MPNHLASANIPPRIRRSQAISLVLLVICGVINYLDRATLAVANEYIRADLGLSLGEMGVLLSAFSWSYAICQLPVGALVDTVGPRWLLGAGLEIGYLYWLSRNRRFRNAVVHKGRNRDTAWFSMLEAATPSRKKGINGMR